MAHRRLQGQRSLRETDLALRPINHTAGVAAQMARALGLPLERAQESLRGRFEI
jgi:hypothetical protein